MADTAKVVKLRRKVFEEVQNHEGSITSHELLAKLGRKGGTFKGLTLASLSNNLRVLRDREHVDYDIDGTTKHWFVTGDGPSDKSPVAMLLPLPHEVHAQVVRIAETKRKSKVWVLIHLLREALKKRT